MPSQFEGGQRGGLPAWVWALGAGVGSALLIHIVAAENMRVGWLSLELALALVAYTLAAAAEYK